MLGVSLKATGFTSGSNVKYNWVCSRKVRVGVSGSWREGNFSCVQHARAEGAPSEHCHGQLPGIAFPAFSNHSGTLALCCHVGIMGHPAALCPPFFHWGL